MINKLKQVPHFIGVQKLRFFFFNLISAFSSSITYLVSVLWAWCQAWGQDDG